MRQLFKEELYCAAAKYLNAISEDTLGIRFAKVFALANCFGTCLQVEENCGFTPEDYYEACNETILMALTFNQDRFQGDKINLDEIIVLAGEQELVR